MSRWIVYILRCADGTLYTGITNDMVARLAKHNAGKGAKYTRGRGPCEVIFAEAHKSRAAALRREAAIKKMKRHKKHILIDAAARIFT